MRTREKKRKKRGNFNKSRDRGRTQCNARSEPGSEGILTGTKKKKRGGHAPWRIAHVPTTIDDCTVVVYSSSRTLF